jgi:hypothetical protein
VVHVEIDDSYPSNAVEVACVLHTDCDVVKETEAERLGAFSVVPGGANHAEGRPELTA